MRLFANGRGAGSRGNASQIRTRSVRGSDSSGAENNAHPSSLLDSQGCRPSPLPLELVLDVEVREVEVDRRRLKAVVAEDLLHRRQADPLLQGRRGERVPQHVRAHVLGDPRAVGHRLDDVLGPPCFDRETPSPARSGAPGAPARGATSAPRGPWPFLPWGPPLPLIRSWRCCQRTFFAVRPHSSLTRSPVSSKVQTTSRSVVRLAGVGETIGFVGGERFSHVLIRHLPPPKSCVVGVGPRSRCVFRPPGYPRRRGCESGFPRETRGIGTPGRVPCGMPGCVNGGGQRGRRLPRSRGG